MNLILFCLATIGLTHIIVDSSLFKPMREWFKENFADKPETVGRFIHKVISCYQCCGTWVGWGLGLMLFWGDWRLILVAGFAGSFISQLAALIMVKLEV